MCLQLANVVPLLHVLVVSKLPPARQRRANEAAVYAFLTFGAVTCGVLAGAWDTSTTVAGRRHSVALFALVFAAGVVDCMSSVTFWPFAGVFPPVYLVGLSVGEVRGPCVVSVCMCGVWGWGACGDAWRAACGVWRVACGVWRVGSRVGCGVLAVVVTATVAVPSPSLSVRTIKCFVSNPSPPPLWPCAAVLRACPVLYPASLPPSSHPGTPTGSRRGCSSASSAASWS